MRTWQVLMVFFVPAAVAVGFILISRPARAYYSRFVKLAFRGPWRTIRNEIAGSIVGAGSILGAWILAAGREWPVREPLVALALGLGFLFLLVVTLEIVRVPVNLDQQLRERADATEAKLRREGQLKDFLIKPYVRPPEILLSVLNNGPAGEFGAKVRVYAGIGDAPDPPWEIAWRDRKGPLRRIGHGDNEVLTFCRCEHPTIVDFPTPTGDYQSVWLKGPPDTETVGWRSEEAIFRLQVFRNDPWVDHSWTITFTNVFAYVQDGTPIYVPEIGKVVQHT